MIRMKVDGGRDAQVCKAGLGGIGPSAVTCVTMRGLGRATDGLSLAQGSLRRSTTPSIAQHRRPSQAAPRALDSPSIQWLCVRLLLGQSALQCAQPALRAPRSAHSPRRLYGRRKSLQRPLIHPICVYVLIILFMRERMLTLHVVCPSRCPGRPAQGCYREPCGQVQRERRGTPQIWPVPHVLPAEIYTAVWKGLCSVRDLSDQLLDSLSGRTS
jgi:hypothetical protein